MLEALYLVVHQGRVAGHLIKGPGLSGCSSKNHESDMKKSEGDVILLDVCKQMSDSDNRWRRTEADYPL